MPHDGAWLMRGFGPISGIARHVLDDGRTEGRFARRAGFVDLTGVGVDAVASTTRGDENVRTPCIPAETRRRLAVRSAWDSAKRT